MLQFTCQCERPHRVFILSFPYSRTKVLVLHLSSKPSHAPALGLGGIQLYTEFRD